MVVEKPYCGFRYCMYNFNGIFMVGTLSVLWAKNSLGLKEKT